jgi:hypothetical protein
MDAGGAEEMSGAVTEDRAVAQRGGPTVAATPVGLSQFF